MGPNSKSDSMVKCLRKSSERRGRHMLRVFKNGINEDIGFTKHTNMPKNKRTNPLFVSCVV